jgi:molybdopterin/thiamine biosynthesis adenylyltransferase
VTPITDRADKALLNTLVPQADVVIDCCDNFETRQAVNLACVVHRKPLVSGAAIRMDGQVSVFDSTQADAPCYACIFPPEQSPEEWLEEWNTKIKKDRIRQEKMYKVGKGLLYLLFIGGLFLAIFGLS